MAEQQAAAPAALGGDVDVAPNAEESAAASPPNAPAAAVGGDAALQQSKHLLDAAIAASERRELEMAELKAALAAAEKWAAAAKASAADADRVLRQVKRQLEATVATSASEGPRRDASCPPKVQQQPQQPSQPPQPPPQQQQGAGLALPFEAVLEPLLTQKVLEAVDVCELGCVNRELRECVRKYWAAAALRPGTQRRLLKVAGDGAAAAGEGEGDGTGGLVGRCPDWSLTYKRGQPVKTPALVGEECSCCAMWGTAFPFPFSLAGWEGAEAPAADAPLGHFTFDDWMGPVLCRSCYRHACVNAAPDHSVEARYALEGWNTLVKKYGTPLPLSILKCSVKRLRPMGAKGRPLFEFMSPHACISRAANFALTLKTPSDLHALWRRRTR